MSWESVERELRHKLCDHCVYADWSRTSAGRLHPSKEGRCQYRVKIPALPSAFHWIGGEPRPLGGHIERGKINNDHCPYYQEKV